MVATRRARQTTLRGSDGGYAKAARTAKGAEEESAHAAEGEAAPLKTHRKPTAAVHSTEAVCHVVRVAALYHGTEVLNTLKRVSWDWYTAAMRARVLAPQHKFGELKSGRKLGRFDRPHACAFKRDGGIVIADCDNFRLQEWTQHGEFVCEVSLNFPTGCPTGIAMHGELAYVVQHGMHRVVLLGSKSPPPDCQPIFLEEGVQEVATAGGWGSGNGQLKHPWGCCLGHHKDLATDPSALVENQDECNVIWVTDTGNHRVCAFEHDLDFLTSVGSYGTKPGQLIEPKGLVSWQGELFVADATLNRIQVYTIPERFEGSYTAPKHARLLGGPGSAPGLFRRPMGVCLDPFLYRERKTELKPRLFVAEELGERVSVLTLDGLPLQLFSIGASPSGLGFSMRQPDHPSGVREPISLCVTLLGAESFCASSERKCAIQILELKSRVEAPWKRAAPASRKTPCTHASRPTRNVDQGVMESVASLRPFTHPFPDELRDPSDVRDPNGEYEMYRGKLVSKAHLDKVERALAASRAWGAREGVDPEDCRDDPACAAGDPSSDGASESDGCA